ncbi:hypothetical protein Tco_1444197 [Tanacetum coccineum]
MGSYRPGSSRCKLSGIPYFEVNSRRYSSEIVDTASSSCIVSLTILTKIYKGHGVLSYDDEIPWVYVTCAVASIFGSLATVSAVPTAATSPKLGGHDDV